MKKAPAYLGKVMYWLSWPVLFFYLRRTSRTRVLVMSGDNILLVKSWLGSGRWSLPGGGLHKNEEPAIGAIREVYEETGLRLDPQSLRALASEWRSQRGLKFYCHFFVAKVNDFSALSRQHYEVVAVDWVPVSRLSNFSVKNEVKRALELASKN